MNSRSPLRITVIMPPNALICRAATPVSLVREAPFSVFRPGEPNSLSPDAQVTARGFYERAGYTAVGEEYEEAGIRHVTMRRPLP